MCRGCNPHHGLSFLSGIRDDGDQASIETLFGHVKGEWPHLEHITDSAELETELDRVQVHYNTVCASRPGSAMSPHRRSTKDAATRSAKSAVTGSTEHATTASSTVEHTRKPNHDHAPPLAGYFQPRMPH